MDETQQVAGRPVASEAPLVAGDRDRLVRLAYRFLWNRDEAEDVAHEALLKAHRRGGDLRDRTAWWGWVCQIVVHKCHDVSRRRLRRRRHEPRIARRAGAGDEVNAPDEPGSSRTEAVREAMMRLPRRQREVLVLRHLEGLSYEAIGEMLQIAPATARVHAKAALENLRDRVAEPLDS